MSDYADFCRDKLDYSYVAGFPCELDEIHASLMPHQRAIVRWAVEGGQASAPCRQEPSPSVVVALAWN
jgi:hypothetical protein